ncbi:tRNA pseudouridine(13) synthase TruD [Nitratiruptor sp. SB155-2]|uniref:tRNA pseudouridine synthase D n=1 Tax=Nitratiruptor sp. (strain SB155-2) TaxID=387092 RepID=TRUD_NITSB|nr:tRNA pseudouridine(13) synthase TruD [Nitratiruptor sp. SB155-2]A6Q2U7.1 RecName: Full=tRNA pseudouridine synthase D; AltName: Full=tRNA pseudouridine(13) synthase; AltName: Full=tRNA pseudouridylate synthase D; AltName: Full=tRNA-uridine isomerase D [Nitratiruptor sp. SB155-2]BAF69806.1 tRNA pseudouridine synthase D [Nitratiruptor sp. SB155-2]
MDRLFFLDHSPIDFYFKQSPETFVVEEVPLYPFSGAGEHLIVKVRKKNMTTWQMLQSISEQVGVKIRDIGYAGLKDKNALTYQYISLHKKYEEALKKFSHPLIKTIELTYHKNKIRRGHLKGNRFFIRLKKVKPVDAKKIDEVLKILEEEGMPNFFGYQRFGIDGDNWQLGKEIVEGKRKERNKTLKKLLINAYQSHLFNLWLSKRIELSKLLNCFTQNELSQTLDLPRSIIKELQCQKPFFKLFPGDIAMHYPNGKIFGVEDVKGESERFFAKAIAPTGLLPGVKTKRCDGLARDIEKDYDDERISEFGDRRYAWIFPQELHGIYKEKNAWYELSFFLPKGSYATVLLEEIAHRKIKGE